MKAWEWKATWVLAILVVIVWVSVQAAQPCTLSFKVIPGKNFNQPYPVYQHGVPGDQCIQTTDIYGHKLH